MERSTKTSHLLIQSALLRSLIHFEVLHRKGASKKMLLSDKGWFSMHSDIELEAVSSTYLSFLSLYLHHTMARSTRDLSELEHIVTPKVASFMKSHCLYSFSQSLVCIRNSSHFAQTD